MKHNLIVALLIMLTVALGQTDNYHPSVRVVFNTGLGVSNFPLTAGSDLQIFYNQYGIACRIIGGVEPILFSDTRSAESFLDRSILIERMLNENISAGTGISFIRLRLNGKYIDNEPYGHYEDLSYDIWGLPLELNFFLNSSVIGLNLKGFANINSENSICGLLLGISLGKLK